jgi:hypothetical protein
MPSDSGRGCLSVRFVGDPRAGGAQKALSSKQLRLRLLSARLEQLRLLPAGPLLSTLLSGALLPASLLLSGSSGCVWIWIPLIGRDPESHRQTHSDHCKDS